MRRLPMEQHGRIHTEDIVEGNNNASKEGLSKLRKWAITLTLSSMTMWITFASSVFSTGTRASSRKFDVPTEAMNLGTGLVVFGFALEHP
ncbi:uncharacterized protein ATNIH1004_003615 [Aspergillus tanneri]|uniref:Uncharacterized protein n=2 Tax=Aspergillus tanneri TaxID=1220188 RepID=A0A5M9MV22_9EURO|nr:uncharacterized protein ATNIH1004_003615 [Aspergillus tanneri]KAA8650925.1 hypothetical protein ATNIH1004_003615 [Aspergillus tanneri]